MQTQSSLAHIQQTFQEASQLLEKVTNDPIFAKNIAAFAQYCCHTLRNNGKIIACGNGGSMCDAMHFAEELSGRYKTDRKPLAAIAISDPSHISCVANDYGYDQVFCRMVEALAMPNDLLVTFSTSGNSPNIVLAVEKAKEKGLTTVGLLGKDGGTVNKIASLPIVIPSESTARIQEIHIKIVHMTIELIEQGLDLV